MNITQQQRRSSGIFDWLSCDCWCSGNVHVLLCNLLAYEGFFFALFDCSGALLSYLWENLNQLAYMRQRQTCGRLLVLLRLRVTRAMRSLYSVDGSSHNQDSMSARLYLSTWDLLALLLAVFCFLRTVACARGFSGHASRASSQRVQSARCDSQPLDSGRPATFVSVFLARFRPLTVVDLPATMVTPVSV